MKKYLLICVTYHSDTELHNFVESVHCAAERVKTALQVDIEIADNGKENLGYLGGALPIYNAKAQDYDYVSISNVDLALAPDFFEQLLKIDDKGIGWIAPDIYTDKINRHENPCMLSRPTQRNFRIWNIIYSSTWIYRLYHALYLLKSHQRRNILLARSTPVTDRLCCSRRRSWISIRRFIFRDLCTAKRSIWRNWFVVPD